MVVVAEDRHASSCAKHIETLGEGVLWMNVDPHPLADHQNTLSGVYRLFPESQNAGRAPAPLLSRQEKSRAVLFFGNIRSEAPNQAYFHYGGI